MQAFLHGQKQFSVSRLLPEILDRTHRFEEVTGEGRAVDKARIVQDRVVRRIAAQRPPFGLHIGVGEPLDILKGRVLFVGIGHNRNALAAQCGARVVLWWVHEEVDLVPARVGVGIEAGEEGEPVHRHGDLTGFERVQALAHIAVGVAGRRRSLVELFIEFKCFDRFGRVHSTVHVIGAGRVFVFETPRVERRGHTHCDPFGATLGKDGGTVDGLAINLAALEELRDLQHFFLALGFAQVLPCGLFVGGLDVGAAEPVLAIEPAIGVAHGGQRVVVWRAFGPCGIGVDRGVRKVRHRDAFGVKEVVQFDIVAVFRATADPLAVTDQQVAEFAARVQFVQHPVREVGPRDELKAHRMAGLRLEFFAEFYQCVGRVPRGPAQGQIVSLRAACE
mmetsp:Transcript_143/g.457  ORF Transcript_143/g.457 Transcript_143/m.457 type:complete len:391 (-) Transcript_143:113-1285(-)